MVFYNRKEIQENQGLTEIKDQEFLEKLKKDFKLKTYMSRSPIICGTIVNKSHAQKTFDRKLKMVRAPLFTLL